MSSRPKFLTPALIAMLEHLKPETVTKRIRRGRYKGAVGGGMGTPWLVRTDAYEKQRGFAPGTLTIEEARA